MTPAHPRPQECKMRRTSVVCAAVLPAPGCAGKARLNESAGIGPRPELPKPIHKPIPTINVVAAKGWSPGTTPAAAPEQSVAAFATGLQHPRWLYVLPNGDVLVAETNAPVRPEDSKGIKGHFFKKYQKKAGGAVPSA